MSEQKIYTAIASIMKEVGHIGKEQTNSMQRYKYRGIDDMYNALHGLFAKHGVFIVSNVLDATREERINKNGTVLIYAIVRMQFDFIATDGSKITTAIEGEGMDSGDKATNKAMSVALKYALMQTFLIPTEEQKSWNSESESHEVRPQQPRQSELSPADRLKKNLENKNVAAMLGPDRLVKASGVLESGDIKSIERTLKRIADLYRESKQTQTQDN